MVGYILAAGFSKKRKKAKTGLLSIKGMWYVYSIFNEGDSATARCPPHRMIRFAPTVNNIHQSRRVGNTCRRYLPPVPRYPCPFP